MTAKDIKKHEFKPGQSGNPNGRPKGSPNRSTIAKKWLETKIDLNNPITGEKQKLTLEEAITLAQIQEAQDGSTKAYNALMDSAHGKAPQSVDVTSQGEGIKPQIIVSSQEIADGLADKDDGL